MSDQPQGIEPIKGPDGQDLYLLEYEIVDGPLEETRVGLTPEVEAEYSDLQERVMTEPAKAVPRLEELVGKYPSIPVLKNWLMAAYQTAGRTADSEAMGERLWREHPDYLFARITRAQHHLSRDELDQVPEVLGKLDLKLMYPHRDVFHVSEVLALWSLLAEWCFRRGEDEQALFYLDQMVEIAPDHPVTGATELRLAPLVLAEAVKRLMSRPRAKPGPRKKSPKAKHTAAKRRKRPPPPPGPRPAC